MTFVIKDLDSIPLHNYKYKVEKALHTNMSKLSKIDSSFQSETWDIGGGKCALMKGVILKKIHFKYLCSLSEKLECCILINSCKHCSIHIPRMCSVSIR